MKKIIIIPFLFLLTLTLANALCTCEFANNPVFVGQTENLICSCSSSAETSKDYVINFYNQAGTYISNSTGTTPSTINTLFSGMVMIPTGITEIQGNLTGNNLEGSDTALVISPLDIDLVITNITYGETKRVGERGSVRFEVYDNNNNTVTNAICSGTVSDSLNNAPIIQEVNGGRTYKGLAYLSSFFEIDTFKENSEYVLTIGCSCINSTDRTCYTNVSKNIKFAVGTTNTIIDTGYWLNETNTLTDKSSYTLDDEYIYVCANVTNPSDKRLPLRINYNYRCGDNNSATDRVVIGSFEEIRGISGNTTQTQCASLLIKNVESIKNKDNLCYAATDVCILNEKEDCNIIYSTTSDEFTLVSNSDEDLPLEDIDMILMILTPFILFLTGLLLVWLGYRSEEESGNFWHIAGGTFWLGSGSSLLWTGSITSGIFAILLGLFAILIGITNLVKNNNEN